jgi:hypothetical protein
VLVLFAETFRKLEVDFFVTEIVKSESVNRITFFA